MKLSKLVHDKIENTETFSRHEKVFELKQYILFDISKNFCQENIPSDILKCIKYTKLNNFETESYLPNFLDMTRKDM